MVKNETRRLKWEGIYADGEAYSGYKSVSWTDENDSPVVVRQVVPKFNALKQKHFYRYLSPGFMKEHKNLIKMYNSIVQEIMRQ